MPVVVENVVGERLFVRLPCQPAPVLPDRRGEGGPFQRGVDDEAGTRVDGMQVTVDDLPDGRVSTCRLPRSV